MSLLVPAQSLWTGPRQDPRRYRVDLDNGALRPAGDGGEGLVYRATVSAAGVHRDVALKMHTALSIDDFARLGDRARVLRHVHHLNVMHLIDAFVGTALVDDDRPVDDDFSVIYTVAEWIPGDPLERARGSSGPVRRMLWVADLARAVAYLHSFRSTDAPDGIVHRDIKPSNVRITPDGRAVLIDFGIARPHGTDDMTQGAGTYLWQAPEVVGGPGTPGPASDAWGIGAVAFWLLADEPPRLDNAEAARAQLEMRARHMGFSDPVGLGRHIARLLEPHPGQRAGDLHRWADDLDVIVAGNRPHRWSSAAVEGLIRHSRLVIGALALIVVLAVVVTTTAVYIGRRNAQNLAQAGELAAESVNTVSTDVKLGSLLAVESSRLATTTQTHDAVVNALEQPVQGIFSSGRPVTGVAFSPNGRLLAADSQDALTLWDAGTGAEVDRHLSHGVPVTDATFSPDGMILAAVEGDRVVLWSTSTGKEIGPPLVFDHGVAGIAFNPGVDTSNPGGEAMLAVGTGADVTFWDPTMQTEVGTTVHDPVAVTSVAFSSSGTLATGDSAGSVVLWEPTTGQRVGFVANASSTAVTAMAFSPDDTTLAVVGQGDYIVLVDTSSGKPIGKSLPDGNRVTSVAFNPDVSAGTNVLASGTNGGNVVVWTITDTAVGGPDEVFQTLGDGSDVSSVAFSADGAELAVGDRAGDTSVWDLRTPIEITASEANAVTSIAFNAGGRIIVAGDIAGRVTFWDTSDGSQEMPALRTGDYVESVALSPDGATLATGEKDGSVELWDLARRTEFRQLPTGSAVYGLVFSPGGRTLAAGDAGDDVRLWTVAPRVTVGPVLPGRHSVRSVAFSPDGQILAAGDDGGDVVLWNVATGRQVGVLVDGSKINSVAFSPDGTLVATGDDAGDVDMWNVTTRRRIASFDDRSSVYSVAFSPNGETLASGDALGDIIPWDIATGTEVGPSLVDSNAVESIAFSSSGATLASGDDAGEVYLFPASFLSSPTETVVAQLCGRIRGNLTRTQWTQYLPHTPYRKVCPGYG